VSDARATQRSLQLCHLHHRWSLVSLTVRRGRVREPLDFDCAFRQQGRQRSDSRQHRRKHDADDANRQWELDHRAIILLDRDPADVALVDEPLDLVDQLATLDFDRLQLGLLVPTRPPFIDRTYKAQLFCKLL
jgi:hypothetical protein